MATASRITLFEREVRERLSRSALDLAFAHAEVMSEGQREKRGGRDTWLGSTMLTIDLPSLAPLLRDACDAGTARRMAALLGADPGLGARVHQIAIAETEKRCGARPRKVETQIQIRAQGARVFLDVDVEGTF